MSTPYHTTKLLDLARKEPALETFTIYHTLELLSEMDKLNPEFLTKVSINHTITDSHIFIKWNNLGRPDKYYLTIKVEHVGNKLMNSNNFPVSDEPIYDLTFKYGDNYKDYIEVKTSSRAKIINVIKDLLISYPAIASHG